MTRILVQPRLGSPFTAESVGGTLRKRCHNGLLIVELPDPDEAAFTVEQLKFREDLRCVESDTSCRIHAVPDDELFSSQWALYNSESIGSDIAATSAWDIRTQASGSQAVIAIIDSGVEQAHPDLESNLWINTTGLGGIHGYNAVADSGDPEDIDGHGTHVAGIIAAVGNNANGVCGVCWKAQMMILKAFEGDSGLLSNIILCLEYILEVKALGVPVFVVNCSWGFETRLLSFRSTLQSAAEQGLIFVFSAGNDGENLTENPVYPAAYGLENSIVVAASTRSDTLASYSNYSQTRVHLAAPGGEIYGPMEDEILSTYIDSGWEYLVGTSMAAPFVAGALALLKSEYPSDHLLLLKARLLEATDSKSALADKCWTGGRLNLYRALTRDVGVRLQWDHEWPFFLPLPSVEYSGQNRNLTEVSDQQFAPVTLRSRYDRFHSPVSVRWQFQPPYDFDDFEFFYGEVLKNGTAAFTLALRYPYNSELTTWIVRFAGSYQASYSDPIWQVEAELELLNPWVLLAPGENSAPLADLMGYYVVNAVDSSGAPHEPYRVMDDAQSGQHEEFMVWGE